VELVVARQRDDPVFRQIEQIERLIALSFSRNHHRSKCQLRGSPDAYSLFTPAMMQRCHWLKPVLVAQVKFTEWTHDEQLRQPVFLGLRTDKEAKDVVRD